MKVFHTDDHYIKVRNGKFHSGTKHPKAKTMDEILEIFCTENNIKDIDLVVISREQFKELLLNQLLNPTA